MSDIEHDEQVAIEMERLRQERLADEQRRQRESEALDTLLATKSCLYIGGVADGSWINTDIRLKVVQAYGRPMLPISYYPGSDITVTIRHDTYRRMDWFCSPYANPHKTFKPSEAHTTYIYVLHGMSDKDAIYTLIRGYHRAP